MKDLNKKSVSLELKVSCDCGPVCKRVPIILVTQAPKPCPYVKEMQDAAMFYTNRVLKEFKEK